MGKCKSCGQARSLVDDLCDNCTIKIYGTILPWFDCTPKWMEEQAKSDLHSASLSVAKDIRSSEFHRKFIENRQND